jgi:hypothetical protein
MKTLARYLVITTLAVVMSGCLGGGEPDFGHSTQAMNEVDAETVPADLMSCDEFYGEDWDTPDMLVGVKGIPKLVVLVQDGEMVCSGTLRQVPQRLPQVDLGELVPLNGADDSLGVDTGDGMGGESAEFWDSPVGDSNPLPAAPAGGESASGEAEDSNPLPATPVGGESASASGSAEDSNPLPARLSSPAPEFTDL